MTVRALFLSLLIGVALCDKNEDKSSVPQDCKWSDWVDHGCSGTCGEHVMRTTKRMKLQEAANGGQRCRGATKRVMPCNLPPCDDEIIPDEFQYPDDFDIDAIDAIDLNPDRSNARIDYEGSDEDHESYPIDNEGSGQREGKDLELTLNTCSPNCKYCKAKGPRATSEWCLLECNNVGAARCLSSWCECY